MEKIIVKKVMDNLFQGNFINGQIGNDGSLILVYSKHNEFDYFERPVLPRDWTIYIIQDAFIHAVSLKNVPLIPTYVDLFSDGSLLVVQPRCEKDAEFIERNAYVYDLDGKLLSSFTIG